MTALVSPLTSFSTDNINKFSSSNGESSLVDDYCFENTDQNSILLIAIESNNTESSGLNPDDGTSDLTESEEFVVELDTLRTKTSDGRPTPPVTSATSNSDVGFYEEYGDSGVCLTKNKSSQSQATMASDHAEKENFQNIGMNSKDNMTYEEPKPGSCFSHICAKENIVWKTGDCFIDSKYDTVKIRRNNRRQRSQRSSNKKWKRLDVEHTGFNFSLIPSLPETEISPVTDAVPEDSNLASGEKGSGPLLAKTPEDEQTLPDEKDRNEELDDEAFFASLGIDVNDSGDIWEWDGIHFDSRSHLTPFKHGYEGSKNPPPSGKTKCVINHSDSASHLTVSKSGHTGPKNAPTKCEEQPIKNYSAKLKNRLKNNKYVSNISKSDVDVLFDFSCVSHSKIYIRPDRHRRAMKAHKAIKTKHANVSDIFNNSGKKRLYMHHRLIKILNISIDFWRETSRYKSRPTPMPKGVDSEWIKGIRLNVRKQQPPPSNGLRTSQPQNLNHVLHETNTPGDLEMDLVGFLLSIQHRDLTPEDYDMLLRLDESVKAKTVSKNVLDTLKTEIIREDGLVDVLCAICMEPYVAGQVRKFLPCEHDFHSDCIDTWLNNSSQNCPLDGLPVVDS